MTYRLTRLAVVDEFPPIARAREWITGRFGEDGSVAYLLACSWCMGQWLAFPVAATAVLWGHTAWWQACALAFTASAVTGLVAGYER